MKMIIAIYKRGESVFERRIPRENNYEAAISINTLTVKYLPSTIASVSNTERAGSPTFRTSPLESDKEKLASNMPSFSTLSPSLNSDKHGCEEAWIV